MKARAAVIVDIGKTLAKASLWMPDGALVARRTRPNSRVETAHYVALDAAGIEAWLADVLKEFAEMADIGAIVPVSHGAGAAIVRDGALVCPPLDYEEAMPQDLRGTYDALRDPFSATGSPALPDGLNLGAQLFRLRSLYPHLLAGDATIMPWAQYWSWLLTGIAASEVTSIGCHTDLWRPAERRYSDLAKRQGWAEHFAPLRTAGEPLGPLTEQWRARTGLSAETRVHCGLHDSNAALLAARGFPEIAKGDATVLSTGTWFVAMRSLGADAAFDIASLPEERDCLVNVDIHGAMVPSARFMGGREIETLSGLDTRRVDIKPDQRILIDAVPAVLENKAMVLPSFAPGFGPFAHGRGRWIDMPVDQAERRAAVCLYAALVANTSLDLIGSRETLLVEGRFAEAKVFVNALAALRPETRVLVSNAHNDVSYGALRLLFPEIAPPSPPMQVQPLKVDLGDYRAQWQRAAQRMEEAA